MTCCIICCATRAASFHQRCWRVTYGRKTRVTRRWQKTLAYRPRRWVRPARREQVMWFGPKRVQTRLTLWHVGATGDSESAGPRKPASRCRLGERRTRFVVSDDMGCRRSRSYTCRRGSTRASLRRGGRECQHSNLPWTSLRGVAKRSSQPSLEICSPPFLSESMMALSALRAYRPSSSRRLP